MSDTHSVYNSQIDELINRTIAAYVETLDQYSAQACRDALKAIRSLKKGKENMTHSEKTPWEKYRTEPSDKLFNDIKDRLDFYSGDTNSQHSRCDNTYPAEEAIEYLKELITRHAEMLEALDNLLLHTISSHYEQINAGDKKLILAAKKASAAIAKAKGEPC